jgi:hypothetical protein
MHGILHRSRSADCDNEAATLTGPRSDAALQLSGLEIRPE